MNILIGRYYVVTTNYIFRLTVPTKQPTLPPVEHQPPAPSPKEPGPPADQPPVPVILAAGKPSDTIMVEKGDSDSFAKSFIEAKKDSYKLFNKTEVSENFASDR